MLADKRYSLGLATLLLGLVFGVSGCEDGAFEQAGEQTERAIERAGDAVEDTADRAEDTIDVPPDRGG
jgi:hypothetical protein